MNFNFPWMIGGNDMTKSQIEKFAVGYSFYPTDCVEEVLKVTNFDEDVARKF